MDSVTQISLGAAVGEATLGRKIGNKAMIWGGLIATIPDLDIIPGQFMEAVQKVDFHRSISHSIVFFILLAPLFGWLLERLYKKKEVGLWKWTLMTFLVLLTHALLDCFTTWGTQLFWPIDTKISFQNIFVIDPIYTLPLLISLIWLSFYRKDAQFRKKLNIAGLVISSLYLAFTFVNKYQANQSFKHALNTQEINFKEIESRPTPFNSILWSANVETKDGFYIGYYSLLDEDQNIDFHYFPKQHGLLEPIENHPKIKKLTRITRGKHIVQEWENGLILNDLRFGQGSGWQKGAGNFIFAYFIKMPSESDVSKLSIVRKENSLDEGEKLLAQYWERMWGV